MRQIQEIMQKDIAALQEKQKPSNTRHFGKEFLPRERIKSFEEQNTLHSPINGFDSSQPQGRQNRDVFSNPSNKDIGCVYNEGYKHPRRNEHETDGKSEQRSTNESEDPSHVTNKHTTRIPNFLQSRRKSKGNIYVYRRQSSKNVTETGVVVGNEHPQPAGGFRGFTDHIQFL